MRPSLWAIVLLLPLVACSVENGGKIFQPKPSGAVQLRLVGGKGGVINSGPAHPMKIAGTFSVWVNEQWYSDYFSATVVSWTGSGEPCWSAPTKPNNTVLTFTAGSTCSPGAVEGIRVSDIFNNQTVQYFTPK